MACARRGAGEPKGRSNDPEENRMTIHQLIKSTDIREVWAMLAPSSAPLRQVAENDYRGPAFWRNGDNRTYQSV